MEERSTDTNSVGEELAERALGGDESALADAFEMHRTRLRRMVDLRIDPRLRGRLDASDVLQEAYIELARELPAFAEKRDLPFHLWLRLVTGRRLTRLHRHHLGAKARDARLEVSIAGGDRPEASSPELAAILLGSLTSVSAQAIRAEAHALLRTALIQMDPIDREILVLRHLEELSNRDAATELGLTLATARKRHLRAVERLRDALEKIPGFLSRD